jgi:hypothetical protein
MDAQPMRGSHNLKNVDVKVMLVMEVESLVEVIMTVR